MKSFLRIIGLSILLFTVNWVYPAWWWVLFLPTLFMFVFSRKTLTGFGNGFVAGLICWGGTIAYQYTQGSDLIAERVAKVFGLNNGILLVIAIALLGSLFASIGGGTGAALRSLFHKKKKYIYY